MFNYTQQNDEISLYENSKLNLTEFKDCFFALTSKLSLSESQSECINEFMRLSLPGDNKLPESHYRFNKSFKNNMIKE